MEEGLGGEREGWKEIVAVGKNEKRKKARERMERKVQRRKRLGTEKEPFLLLFTIAGIAFFVMWFRRRQHNPLQLTSFVSWV